jgi:enterochelin esterase family protein
MKVLSFLLLVTSGVAAQTTQPDRLVSPEVHPDRRVTFHVRAPRAAEVSLFGDWMPAGTHRAMTRDDSGVWSVTLGPLEPGIAIYNFIVDSVPIADPVNPQMKLRARTSASLVDIPSSSPQLWDARDVPHGAVTIEWGKSQALSGQMRQFRVYTPPGYERDASASYPVLYLLHGSNDTAAGWTDVGRANFILDNLLAEHHAAAMIVVMPWGHAVPFDGPREQQANNTSLFERYLLDDVMPAVEKKYRVVPGRENRAIVGLSMGGGQALQIGLGHLDVFSAVGAFSSAVPADFETRFRGLLDHSQATNSRLSLLWIGCGRQDPGFSRNEKLSELLTSHHIRHTFRATEGLHNYAVWRQYLGEIAPLLFRRPGTAEAKSSRQD